MGEPDQINFFSTEDDAPLLLEAPIFLETFADLEASDPEFPEFRASEEAPPVLLMSETPFPPDITITPAATTPRRPPQPRWVLYVPWTSGDDVIRPAPTPSPKKEKKKQENNGPKSPKTPNKKKKNDKKSEKKNDKKNSTPVRAPAPVREPEPEPPKPLHQAVKDALYLIETDPNKKAKKKNFPAFKNGINSQLQIILPGSEEQEEVEKDAMVSFPAIFDIQISNSNG